MSSFTPPSKPCDVLESLDIPYFEPPDDPLADRHKLDVYRPKGKKGCPVVVFLHGGGWVLGSKDGFFGVPVNRAIGQCLAQNGIVAVLPSYRLSPAVRHPKHIEDVARAFAWAYKNAGKRGGRSDQVFVAGHSAGGHLASLLATDETYLEAVGRKRKDIRGVIAVSGVYRLDGFRLQSLVRDPCGMLEIRLDVNPLAAVFGADPKMLEVAAPLTHVRPGLPPFLVIYGGLDLCTLPAMAKEFAAALKANGCKVRVKEMCWRTHETVLYNPFFGADPVTLKAMLEFVASNTTPSRR